MSSASKMFEIGAVALGFVGTVASWRRPTAEHKQRFSPMLIIQSCAENDEGAHTPAASVTIASREGLIALRSAIDEALKEGDPE
jgi:uncharacterized NAD-dependent epimerase/dehydratase family protein